MCLGCVNNNNHVVKKEDIPRIFYPDYRKLKKKLGLNNDEINRFKKLGITGNTLHTYNNEEIELNEQQIEEICDHAVAIVVTGIDNHIDLWAIQWENNYKPKHIK